VGIGVEIPHIHHGAGRAAREASRPMPLGGSDLIQGTTRLGFSRLGFGCPQSLTIGNAPRRPRSRRPPKLPLRPLKLRVSALPRTGSCIVWPPTWPWLWTCFPTKCRLKSLSLHTFAGITSIERGSRAESLTRACRLTAPRWHPRYQTDLTHLCVRSRIASRLSYTE
jgi:hypothetical protein